MFIKMGWSTVLKLCCFNESLIIVDYACGISNIYAFGPTFRAENSHTSRHLAEFRMIEPEIAFCDLQDDMQCAEDYVKFCCRSVLKTCRSSSLASQL